MNAIFNKLITVFWIADIMNMPFMEMFDTTYPLNFWFYFCVFSLWYFLPFLSAEVSKAGAKND